MVVSSMGLTIIEVFKKSTGLEYKYIMDAKATKWAKLSKSVTSQHLPAQSQNPHIYRFNILDTVTVDNGKPF